MQAGKVSCGSITERLPVQGYGSGGGYSSYSGAQRLACQMPALTCCCSVAAASPVKSSQSSHPAAHAAACA